MGNLRTTLSDALSHLLANPLTTLAGILSTVTVAGTYLATVSSPVVPQKMALWSAVVAGLGRVLLGVLQRDAK
ncbi:MAG TPA: hypothetical protein VM554_12965 [Acidisarcina sp.]|nr:hypothetical protein [Acidisarcina sp.]